MGTLISCFYFAYMFQKKDVVMSTQLFLTLIFYFLLFFISSHGLPGWEKMKWEKWFPFWPFFHLIMHFLSKCLWNFQTGTLPPNGIWLINFFPD